MNKQKKILGFIGLTIAMFMGILDSTIINIALPDITAYFHANLNDSSWISTIYVLGLAVFMITASKLADQFGRKKVMMTGLVIFGISSAVCGLSTNLLFLIVTRLFQAIGGAIIMPVVIPMGIELFGKESMRKIAGIMGAVTAIAAAGGPPIGGLLIARFSWQAIFYVNIPFALIAVLLIALYTKESYDNSVSKRIDWIGMILLTASIFFLTFALLKGNDYGWNTAVIIGMFIGSFVTLVLFILAESKIKHPMIELGLFKEHTFTSSTVCYLMTGFGISGPIIILNYFLQNVLGYEALHAAYIVMSVSLTVIISMPLGNLIAGRVGAKPVNFLGLIFLAVGTYLLYLIRVDTPQYVMVIDLVVCGFGFGFTCQSIISAIQHLPDEKSGIGSGIVNAARQLGTCIGIALLVSILNTNMINAKTEIKTSAIETVQQAAVPDAVKSVMLTDIEEMLNGENSTTAQQELTNKLQGDIQAAMQTGNSVSNTAQVKLRTEILRVMAQLTNEKDNKIADAFDKTFLLAAIIILITSVFGLFTDKKKMKKVSVN